MSCSVRVAQGEAAGLARRPRACGRERPRVQRAGVHIELDVDELAVGVGHVARDERVASRGTGPARARPRSTSAGACARLAPPDTPSRRAAPSGARARCRCAPAAWRPRRRRGLCAHSDSAEPCIESTRAACRLVVIRCVGRRRARSAGGRRRSARGSCGAGPCRGSNAARGRTAPSPTSCCSAPSATSCARLHAAEALVAPRPRQLPGEPGVRELADRQRAVLARGG